MPIANNQTGGVAAQFANLKRLAYFAAVVEEGSFTAAADRLGITKAVVSQQVARLEMEFRATLLTRSTRRVQPTEAGLAFYRRCAVILREAGEAFDELGEVSSKPSGTLRLTAPLDYGITAVVPAIAEFTRRFPDCKVEATLRDQSVDLLSGEVELAIRVGWLVDSQLQARRIGSFRQLLVAPSAWRDQLAQLKRPEEISRLPFVANAALREHSRWKFSAKGRERRLVDVHPSITLDATLAVAEAVRNGVGLSVLPDYAIEDDLRADRLMHVLPGWDLPSGGIHAVYPAARFRAAKVRAFVDLLADRERQRAGGFDACVAAQGSCPES